MDHVVRRAAISVLIPVAMATAITWLGCFDSVVTELGFQHYGEHPDHSIPFLPSQLKMPANTLVNMGYTLLGVMWIRKFLKDRNDGTITDRDLSVGSVFCWMAVVYGPVQLLRIVSQQHRFAVMDQWCTLPFFAWVVVMSDYLMQGWNTRRTLTVMAFSCASYALALVHDLGFEVALGVHILFAVLYGMQILQASQSKLLKSKLRWALLMAILSCAGFVVLKLLDLHLARFSVFHRFSGHFWSKVADIMQIHFVCKFFHPIMEQNAKNKKI
ncbi:PREDICTED: transmembrane protein 187-like [Branchiostoma belcheri]|uniref:Transmembrane protein 187-like n=1 Tax=Branchiostoma belcheri TaxID=7741 RepID=A0A6P4YN01_BRABE|nr:PREDICTED: transmembrane protein 187-like [Branchiostoma belcheri]